ncbi:MAG: DNA methylase [Acidobacteria bacterium RIFCSPLOWO2_12_FULL_60_22]|nr:MAG: DNA methylase [Acidobacteria bacterium RIFCSPLOWO2_12_FULL_60_22]
MNLNTTDQVVTTSAMAKRIEFWPLDRLQPYARNARTHSEEQITQIAASILEFGFTQPILVDTKDGILAGHGRLRAAQKLSLAEVPVIVLDHLTEAQKRAYIIADNRLALDAGWDEEMLAAELVALERDGFNLEVMGFTESELEDLLKDGSGAQATPEPQIDNAAELQKKWGTERGQLWLIGKHRLLCGDNTNPDDVRRLMNGKRACLFATDPPYLVAYDGTNHPHKWNDSEELKRRKNKDWSDKYTDVDSPELGEALYDAFVKVAVEHAITDHAAWYCWHASRKQGLLDAVWEKYGAFVHQQIIWAKDRPILTRSWYMWQHEPCFFGWVQGKKPKRVADDYPPTVWSFPTHAAGETTDHPTQKPVELFAIPIRQHTAKGDICYEPFSGSGTQLVAAESLGRVCYTMEKSPPFVAVERLSEMGLQPKLLGGSASE